MKVQGRDDARELIEQIVDRVIRMLMEVSLLCEKTGDFQDDANARSLFCGDQ